MVAPDNIWIAGLLDECGAYYSSAVEAEGDHGGTAVEYARVTPASITLPRAEVEALMEAAQLVSDWEEWALQIGGVCPDRLVGCLGKMRLSLATLQERMK